MARDQRHDILFEPVPIGPRTLRNRFYQTPHSTGFGTHEPGSQARFRATKAAGGWAGVNLEIASIDQEVDRAPVPDPAQLWDDDDVRNLRLLCDEVHAEGSLVGAELWHGGSSVDGSPSRIAPGGASGLPNDAYPMTYPRPLTVAGIKRVVGLYAAAAERAIDAGFDIVYVYGAHGYLPTQFLQRFSNHRDDAYGGSLANRARFWLEALEAVRTVVDGRAAVAVRIGVDPSARSGPGIDEVLGFVRMADDLVDLWDVNTSVIAEHWVDMRPSRLAPQGYQVEVTGRIKEATSKPVVGVSRLTDPDLMADIVRSGAWDLIGGARPSIADPFLPAKIEAGRYDEIRECIGCNICLARVFSSNHIACTQNPTAGEEFRRGWHPEHVPPTRDRTTDVLVVGAGAAGLQAAVTLGRRGYRRVHLVDGAPEVGGYAALAARLPGLGEWSRLIAHRVAALRHLRNVEVITGRTLSTEDVRDYGADLVILATGAEWRLDGLTPHTHLPLPGAGEGRTLVPEQVLAGADVGARVCVYDCEGYFMGVGMAELLAMRGHQVDLVTPLALVGPFLDKTIEGHPTRRRLAELRVTTHADTEIAEVGDGECTVTRFGATSVLQADTVVLVTARQSRNALARELAADAEATRAAGIRGVFEIGDGAAPRLLADCVFDGHRLAMELDGDDPAVPLPYIRERRLVG